ncbi:MAG: TfpX/TfpZ family type IV pilin accessory protein [Pseudomonadota bacterium]
MNKFKAFAAHLSLSLIVVGLVLGIIVFVWYPDPLFTAMSGWDVVKILIFVDLILGPILTFIVYKPNKPSLRFDLSVIAFIQIAALAYGTFVFFKERPLYLVHAIDVFHIVTASEVDRNHTRFDELKQIPLVGPRLAIVFLPDSAEERSKLTEEVVLGGAADIERRPEFYRPYEDHLDKVFERTISLSALQNQDEATKKKIARFKEKHADRLDQMTFVPLKKKYGFMLLAIDKESGLPIAGLDVE